MSKQSAAKEGGEPLEGQEGAAATQQQRLGMVTDEDDVDEDEDYSKDSDFSNNNLSEEEIWAKATIFSGGQQQQLGKTE